MAWIIREQGQKKTLRGVEFQSLDGSGSTAKVRLGAVSEKRAQDALRYIEDLIRAKTTGSAPRNSTQEWIAEVPAKVRKRLERAELIEHKVNETIPTLGEWLDRYIDGRKDWKPRTRRNCEQARDNLVAFFGAAKALEAITPADAKAFRIYLRTEHPVTRGSTPRKGLKEGTVQRRCKRAKQFFAAAVEAELICKSPFAGLKCGTYAEDKFHFISRKDAQRIFDACPDHEWRLLFALARYGGLRVPSEALRLKWGHIDWAGQQFTVESPKTEHHDGKASRKVPIFYELLPYLREAFELAEPGAEYVITRYRGSRANLRTQLHRIIVRAGLEPWSKPFTNLRATRETELADVVPEHVVTKWLGNTGSVAKRHYLRPTDEHLARVVTPPKGQEPGAKKTVGNPVGNPPATDCMSTHGHQWDEDESAFCDSKHKGAALCDSATPLSSPPRGLEPLSSG